MYTLQYTHKMVSVIVLFVCSWSDLLHAIIHLRGRDLIFFVEL